MPEKAFQDRTRNPTHDSPHSHDRRDRQYVLDRQERTGKAGKTERNRQNGTDSADKAVQTRTSRTRKAE